VVERDEHGRFIKGNKGSGTGGRPKGLAEQARCAVDDGLDLVTFYKRVFRGEEKGAHLRERMEAANWLAERGWGKATQYNENNNTTELVLTADDLHEAKRRLGEHQS
jgi:hypothetical protein